MTAVTILFTDIEKSTVIAAALGDAVYNSQMRLPHFEALETEIARNNGVILHGKGDGVVAYFPTASDAVAASVTLQTRFRLRPQTATDDTGETHQLRVRMGLHTGDLMADGQPSLNALNYAFRIEVLADAGQIVLSEATHTALCAERGVPPFRCLRWPGRFLKGIQTLETVYELDYDGIGRQEPGTQFIHNLYQEPANNYVVREGKEGEVLTAFQAIKSETSAMRLVTVRAEGGMGKTRLAVTCGKRLAVLFPQGVYFVSLAQTARDRKAVAEAIGATLKLPTPNEEHLLAFLHQRKELLLLLDNVESVRCTDVQDLIVEMLDAAPDLCLLATGREPIGLTDLEQCISLDAGMTYDEARALFLDRAALRKVPPDAEDPALRGLLEDTFFIPLAIELLAAWWDTYRTLGEMAKDYALSPQSDLTGTPEGSRRSDDASTRRRHRSLTDSFDWSWGKLGEVPGGVEAQRVFAAVSLFAVSFEEAAVSAVMDMPKIRPLLHRLLQASLLRLDQNAATTRYTLHRFSRDYGTQKLSDLPPNDSEAIRNRFVAYHLQLLSDNLNLNEASCREILTAEWQNIIAAQKVAETDKDWQSVILLSNLGNFLGLRSLWAEQERLYEAALQAAQASGNRYGEAHTLMGIGNVYDNQGRWHDAVQTYQQSLIVYQDLNDRHGEAHTIGNLGNVYLNQGRWAEAIQCYQDSLKTFRDLGDKHGEGLTLTNLGSVYGNQERWQESIQCFQNSLTIKRDLGDKHGEAQTLTNLGNVYQNQGRWAEAIQCYQDSLTINRDLGDRYGEGLTLTNLGSVYGNQERWQESIQCFQNSLTIKRDLGDKHGEAQTLTNLGIVYQNQGRWEEAIQCYQASLNTCQDFGDRYGEGMTLINMAVLLYQQGQPQEALDWAQQAVRAFEQTEDTILLTRARELVEFLSAQ